jgi:hypothetical protein
MRVEVLLSSGETDGWNNVDDAQVNDGHLIILSEIDGDEVPAWMKTIVVETEVESHPGHGSGGVGIFRAPYTTSKRQEFHLQAVYAPGMWMKVVYLEG